MMQCNFETINDRYVPPPLGNGDISLQIDYEGVMQPRNYLGMTPGIYRAGRRYDSAGAPLVPFGYFLQNNFGPARRWTQQLDVQNAQIVTDCEYENGTCVATQAFVHLQLPLLAVHKRFNHSYTFCYYLAIPGTTEQPRRLKILPETFKNGVAIHYQLDGMRQSHGIISLWCDAPGVLISVCGNEFRLTVPSAGEASFFIAMHDSLDCEDVNAAELALRQLVERDGFNGLFASHQMAWAQYYRENYVRLPDEKVQKLYLTAQYHLRISSTQWSLPIGIFPSHWEGRYFPFDSHFSAMGLLTSGHSTAARKVSDFHFQTLKPAVERAHLYFGENNSGGRWYWELLEDGTSEGAIGGFWLEHIFHMANIAMSAWQYFRFTGDIDFLTNRGYPVMTACADFYQAQSIQALGDGRYIVGKCTDLERLGPGRDNAFMTTCGVIATLEAVAAAEELLDIEPAKRDFRRFLAGKLRETLPADAGRYIPYPGCQERSIAVFSGMFPYPVLSCDDPRLQAAAQDYLANEDSCGNMYPVGHSVCIWYAGWKGIALVRLGNFTAARRCIEQCVEESASHCFSEVFEIDNPPHHPWFTTAEGSLIQLVNEFMLQSSEGQIRLPDNGWGDYEFKLPAIGGVTVEVCITGKQVRRLVLHATVPYRGQLFLPDGKQFDVTIKSGEVCVILG